MKYALELKNISKKHVKNYKASVNYSNREFISNLLGIRSSSQSLRKHEFYALKNISFYLKKGEVLGVLGKNGAGKSTLVKIISGIYSQDSGFIQRNGSIQHIIEITGGLVNKFSGLQNIMFRAQTMGLDKKQTNKFIHDVIEFSELHEFINSPVIYYSSGMKARLAFAMSILVESDIKVIDEVLAVGDMQFRLKCFNKISELKQKSSIIFVSHSLANISRLCDRAIFLEKGRLLHSGSVNKAIDLYLEEKNSKPSFYKLNEHMVILSFYRHPSELKICNVNDPVKLTMRLLLPDNINKVVTRIFVTNISGEIIQDWNSIRSNFFINKLSKEILIKIDSVDLSPGVYSLQASLMNMDNSEIFAISDPLKLKIKGLYLQKNTIQRKANWKIIR